MYRPLNSTTPFSTDYRGLLVAKITAKHTPFTGAFSGRPVYEWVEQQIGVDGDDEDAPAPRRGTYTNSITFDNILVDINDTELSDDEIEAGYYTWIRMKGVVGGATVYESAMTPPTGTIPTTSGCTPPGIDSAECLEFTVVAGAGRCAAITAASLDASASGGWWVSDTTFTTAAGAATVRYRIIPSGTQIAGYPEMKLTVGVTDYFGTPAGCNSAGATRFAFGGSTLCGGTVSTLSCANGFFIDVSCIPCPMVDPCAGWYCCAETGTVTEITDCTDLDAFCQSVPGGPTVTGLDCDSLSPQTEIGVTYTNTTACLEDKTVIHYLFPSSGLPKVWVATKPTDCPEECEADFNFTCSTATADAQLVVFGASWELVSFDADPFRAVFRLNADTACAADAETIIPEGSTAVVTLVGAGTVRGPYATEAEAITACTYSACCDDPGEPLADHPDLELTVPDSAYAGTYKLMWAGAAWQSYAIGGIEGDYWSLACAAGVWTLDLYNADVVVRTGTDTPAACAPLALTFAGADFDTMGDLTVAVL